MKCTYGASTSPEMPKYWINKTTTICVFLESEIGAACDGFLGQLCTMLLPHTGPEAFVGGPGGAAMLPYLKGCRCLVGALAYLGSLRVDVGGLRSDFYPDVLLDLDDFPRCPPVAGLDRAASRSANRGRGHPGPPGKCIHRQIAD